MMKVGDTIRIKSLNELIRTGWTITEKKDLDGETRQYLVPPYWKDDCGVSPLSVMLGQTVDIIEVNSFDKNFPYHVQRRLTRDKLWVTGMMISNQ